MGLRQALDHLPTDRATESMVRELLHLLRAHVDEPMSSSRIAERIGGRADEVSRILSALTKYSLLRHEDAGYVYPRDLLVDVDVERFARRVETHSRYVRENVAKFRDRYGQR